MTEGKERTADQPAEGSNRSRGASSSPEQSLRLCEEHLAYGAVLLLLTWSTAVLLWGTGHLSYAAARWIAFPSLALVSLVALLNNLGRERGLVTRTPEDRERRVTGVVAAGVVIAMGSTMVAILL